MEEIKKHTPGPWHIFQSGAYFGVDAGSDSGMEKDDKTIIAYGDDGDDITGVRGETYEEMVANAKLIAAAPELLEALQYLMSYEVMVGKPAYEEMPYPIVTRIQAAIKKATE